MDPTDPEPQDATERLRARLAGRPIALTPRPGRAVMPWVLAAMLFVFALGLIANPWFERSVRSQLPGFDRVDGAAPDLTATRAQLAGFDARLRAVEARPAQRLVAPAPGSQANERVAALEARLDGVERGGSAATARIDALTTGIAALTGRVDANAGQIVLTLQAARADADRAQGALAILAARRAIERGGWSPGLATPLRTLFGQRSGTPAALAVEQVAALGATPVTLATLRDGLRVLRLGRAEAGSWWANLAAGLASVVEVRDRDTGSDALARADAALAAGNVARAVAAVATLPRTSAAAAWLAAAQRYQAGQRALATLEEAALTMAPVAASPLVR